MTPSATFLSTLHDCTGFCRESFIAAHHAPPPVSVRVNKAKLISPDILFSPEVRGDAVPWCSDALYLNERPSFTLDPLIHGGAYYVQEASSMFISHMLISLLHEQRNLKALDLCAAPGGKATLLASSPYFNLILANEIIQSRVSSLVENIVKWGADHVLVSQNDPRELEQLGDMFDVVLVDAPCSGSGLFRKDEQAQNEWSPDGVIMCAGRQKRILHSASMLVKEGGYLMYSTCSFSKEENEDIVDHLIDSGMYESVKIPIEPAWGIVESVSEIHAGYGYRFYPDKLRGEGFFCAVLRKTTTDAVGTYRTGSAEVDLIKDINLLNKWIRVDEGLIAYQKGSEVFVCQEQHISDVMFLKKSLKLKRSGLRIGDLIRNELIPDHELAMSTVRSDQIPGIELDLHSALRFLRRDSIEVDVDFSGWGLVHYKEVVLGWIKMVNGRAKNHYPMSWRILMRG